MNFNRHSSTLTKLSKVYSLNLFLFLLPLAAAAQQKEIEITSFYAKVYVAPSTNANFIGLTQQGKRYPVLGVRDSWYNIRFQNANGWIQFSQVKRVDETIRTNLV